MIKAVFFDLDGTLLDTARDMAGALNRLLIEQDQQPLDYHLIRSEVSHGARAMIHLGFGIEDEDSERFQQLRQRFLDIYQDNIANETVLFPHMDEVLDLLETRQIPWGVVTNKPSWLTTPLLEILSLSDRAEAVICADTAGVSKPHPKPVMDACEAVDVDPADAIYVGDDERDVIAAHAAGMPCIALRCGYIRRGQNVDNWGADMVMETTLELRQWLTQQTNSSAA
jgi:phosphoglycolate phosphatase